MPLSGKRNLARKYTVWRGPNKTVFGIEHNSGVVGFERRRLKEHFEEMLRRGKPVSGTSEEIHQGIQDSRNTEYKARSIPTGRKSNKIDKAIDERKTLIYELSNPQQAHNRTLERRLIKLEKFLRVPRDLRYKPKK